MSIVLNSAPLWTAGIYLNIVPAIALCMVPL